MDYKTLNTNIFIQYIAESNGSVMRYIKTFENYFVDGEGKAEELEQEKEDTSNLRREKELQKMKDEKEKQDNELRTRRKLFKKKKVA